MLRVLNCLGESKPFKSLMKNVIVTGGNTITPYFNNLVVESIESFAKEQNIATEVITSQPDIASYTTWLGGSILGSLVDFESFYITSQQIQEQGSGVFERNCP